MELILIAVPALDGNVVLGKAHPRSAPTFSSLTKAFLETAPISGWTQIVHDLGG